MKTPGGASQTHQQGRVGAEHRKVTHPICHPPLSRLPAQREATLLDGGAGEGAAAGKVDGGSWGNVGPGSPETGVQVPDSPCPVGKTGPAFHW